MRRGLIGIIAMLLLGAACSSSSQGPPEKPLGSLAALNELRGVDQLKATFNEDEGVPRIILLMSPT